MNTDDHLKKDIYYPLPDVILNLETDVGAITVS